jgi:hypothetical protein
MSGKIILKLFNIGALIGFVCVDKYGAQLTPSPIPLLLTRAPIPLLFNSFYLLFVYSYIFDFSLFNFGLLNSLQSVLTHQTPSR